MDSEFQRQELLREFGIAEGAFQNLNNFIRIMRVLQERDMDALVPFSSFKGMGKSTGWLAGTRIYLETYFPELGKHLQGDLRRYMPPTGDMDALMANIEDTKNDYLPLAVDEGIDTMSSEDWARGPNKRLKKVFTKCRPHHRIVFVCIPNFFWLDKKYREDMTFFWIHIITRGTGILFTTDCKIGIKDRWHKKEFEDVKGRLSIFSDTEKYTRMYKSHPCYLDTISLPKCDAALYEKYKSLRESDTKAADKPQSAVKERRVNIGEIVDACTRVLDNGDSLEEVGYAMGYSPELIGKWVRERKFYLEKQKAEKQL